MRNLETLKTDTLRFMCCSTETAEHLQSLNNDSFKRYLHFKENESTMKEEDFNKLYKKHKKDIDVLFVLSKSRYCPSSIIEQIMADNDKSLSVSILRNIVNREDTTDARLEQICTDYEYDLENIVSQRYRKDNATTVIKLVPENVLSKLIDITARVHGIHTSNNLLRYSEDEKLVEKYIYADYEKESDREYILSTICSNTLLPDETRNVAYNEGCSVEKLYEFTPYMVESIYMQCVDAMDEINRSSNPNELWHVKALVYQVLGEIVNKNLLPESLQIDYVNRIKEANPRAMDDVLTNILLKTKSQTVLQIAKTLKSKDSINAYKNPNMDKKDIKERATDYCDKIIKAREKKNRWSDVWLDYLREFIPRVQLKDEHYNLLITMGKGRMNETIACSPYTPISVLEKLIEIEQEKIKTANRDYVVRSSNKNISLANINIVCQKTNMSPEIITETLHFFEKSGHTFGTSKVPTKYERNLISAYKSGVGNETFEQIRNAMINSYSDLDEGSKSKASRFEYVVSYIEKEEKIYDCETYETMSLFALEKEKENIFRKVANDGKDGIDTLYENVEKNLNKYNQINRLIAERKSEIEKEGVDIDAR